jgi:hypothetical protein
MRHVHRNLIARSRPARTFASLAAFVALVFLASGLYLITQPLIDPLSVHDAGIVAGAFVIALASILLFYVVKPGVAQRRAPAVHRLADSTQEENSARPNCPNGITLEPVHLRSARMPASLDGSGD